MARAVFDGVVHAASSTTSGCFWKGKANYGSVVVLSVAGIIAAVDQFTKAFALLILSDGPQTFGPFRFVVVRNPGGPFGIATGASLFWTLITLSIVLAAIASVIGGRLYLPSPSGKCHLPERVPITTPVNDSRRLLEGNQSNGS